VAGMPGRKLLVWFGVVLGVLFLCSYLVWAGVSDNATSTASVVPEKIRKEFIEAVKKDDVEKVRKLIESGKIGLNQALDDVKNVPLHYSAYYGALKVTQFLVEKGADVNIKDVGGVTPLSMAAYGNHTAVARFLVKNGADVNIRDEDGGTPLLNAAYNNNFELVKFLVEHGADVNIKTVDGQTPLINAAGLGNFEMVKFLVEHGADVNVQNKDGITPLINAVFAGNVEVVKFLLRHGAKIKPEMKNLKVLIAEDEDHNYLFLEVVLKPYCSKIDRAITGKETIEKALSFDYDFILMDLKMPDTDGVEATRKLREQGLKTPIIVQTAFVSEEIKMEVMKVGIDDYVVKPIRKDNLLAVINRVVSKYQL
jgi:ankyrin repeat protein